MNRLGHLGALVREAFAIARSQCALTAFVALVSAGMIVIVLLTVGRTVAAQTEIVASIDQAGTRSIVIRLQPGAQVTPAVLSRIAVLDGVASAAAFGPAVDVRSTLVPDGPRVALRWVMTADPSALGLPSAQAGAWASPHARQQLGLIDSSGRVDRGGGTSTLVTGGFSPSEHLRFLGPVILEPVPVPAAGHVDAAGVFTAQRRGTHAQADRSEVAMLVVLAATPNLVAPLSRAIAPLLGAADPDTTTAETSEALARLRGLVDDQLSIHSRGMLLGALAVGGLLLAATLQASVALRRKDYGRRRALGASQRLVGALVVTQASLVVAGGAIAGAVGAHTGMALTGLAAPRPTFTLALTVLAVATGAVAALVPAVVAARRDPLTELRVP